MLEIKYVRQNDKDFWFSLDKHLPIEEFEVKVKRKQGYVIFDNNKPIGLLRYNLFWDSIPFCTMLYIKTTHQKSGYGSHLMQYWEKDMKQHGYDIVLISTQVDETAQHFYRKLGYKDCGGLLLNSVNYHQPMELFMVKSLF